LFANVVHNSFYEDDILHLVVYEYHIIMQSLHLHPPGNCAIFFWHQNQSKNDWLFIEIFKLPIEWTPHRLYS